LALGLSPSLGRRDETLRWLGDSEIPLTERLVGILLARTDARGSCETAFFVTVTCDEDRGIDEVELSRSKDSVPLATAAVLLTVIVEGRELLRSSSVSSWGS
jgi:hypothetical protein